MLKEIWKDVDGFPGYQISDQGRVRGFRDFHGNITNTYKILKPRINKDGYYELTLYTTGHKKITKRVHRLVAITFLGNRDGLVINHINCDKLDNRLKNLEWVTAKENSTLASQNGLYKTKPVKIVETGEIFKSIKECADAINTHPSNISEVLSGRGQTSRDLHFELVNEKEYKKYEQSKQSSFLYPHQRNALKKMFNGCILNGGTGSGKSRTGLYYYFSKNGGSIENGDFKPMRRDAQDLYIITTAKKRNDMEWEGELIPFLLSTDPKKNVYCNNKIVVDSWNNIKKYAGAINSFFIFDEDKVTGKGAWANSFLKITKSNDWIILSASPGDCWEDFETVFVANGFFRNRTEFRNEHLVYSRFTKFPKVDGYRNEGRLIRLKSKILIDMDFKRHTVQHHEDIFVKYNTTKYKDATKTRWDPYKNEPIQQAAGLCYVLRRIVNEDESRAVALLELFEKHPKMIIFYSFDYERDILLNLYYGENVEVAEYSGHAHQKIPTGDSWVYLVNYSAGCEGWNSIATDTIVFYSQNYSYKVMLQATGRIDRLNSPFTDLYYYHLKTRSGIDLAISKALRDKKKFNERKFTKWD